MTLETISHGIGWLYLNIRYHSEEKRNQVLNNEYDGYYSTAGSIVFVQFFGMLFLLAAFICLIIVVEHLDSKPNLKLETEGSRSYIYFKPEATKKEIESLLEELWKNNFDISFHDTIHPTISDPGAYFSYSTTKNIGPEYWSMTYGNYGWSGGIYHLKKETVNQQIYNLVKNKKLTNIQITEVVFFSHYDIESEAKSVKKNNEIYSMHKN